jgi:hypothetical protein
MQCFLVLYCDLMLMTLQIMQTAIGASQDQDDTTLVYKQYVKNYENRIYR